MIFGADYYPEHWDRGEWEKQAKLMRECNMNTVRIGEFAWKLFESEEGRFDFSLMDDAMEILKKEGISVIMGTPTAAPPKWLVNKYDVLMRDKYGRARGWGSRRECCANNPDYIQKSKIIVREMAKHYTNNKQIIAWQIDNEFGCHNSTRCYCEHCRRAFAKWLEQKYGTIENLNKSWGTAFWSLGFESFDDIILPTYNSCEGDYGNTWSHNPSLDLDYRRFASDSWVKYQQMQIDIIREYTNVPITHNLMGHFSDIDYYKLSAPLDVASWDNYPDNQWGDSDFEYVSMAHELMRGVKDKNFWVMEEESGPCGWDTFGGMPRPNQLRLWTYQAIAHGCEGMVYFRFRAALFGMEQYWYGILDHDGVPRRRYYEIQKTGAEIKKLAGLFEGARNKTDVLIVKSYENVWSHEIKRHVKNFDYRDVLYRYYRANNRLGTNPVCGSEDMISDKYKVVYMPAYIMVSDEIKERLEKYVSEGGTLVLTYRSGVKDMQNNMLPQTLPAKLRNLAGVTVEEFDSSAVRTKLFPNFGEASVWRDILKLETAETVVKYDSEFYRGSSAITVNKFGAGKVWYVGCDLEDEPLLRLVKMISDEAGAEYISQPDGVEAVKRECNGTEYTMILNYTDVKKKTDITGTSLMNGCEFEGDVDGYGVEIIERSK